MNYVSLETIKYISRSDFLKRLQAALKGVEEFFQPVVTERVGLRYIDQLSGDAVDRICELVQPSFFGSAATWGHAI